jgi:hypothetical protein
MPKAFRKAFNVLCIATMLTAVTVWGQTNTPDKQAPTRSARESPGEFQFVRLAYAPSQYCGRGYGRQQMWRTDYPDADHHFVKGVDRLTRIAAAAQPRILTPMDNDIYDFPWIYAVEVGYWDLNEKEAGRMREYLLRGGFLMVDDFHGSCEWSAFVASMSKVFPDRPIIEIPESDEAFHVIYDLDQRIQIPSAQFLYTGVTWEKDGYEPHWRGIYDSDGRLMVAINFNMDIGDAWEHADWPDYPENMTALAYRFGINYLVYAMTH